MKPRLDSRAAEDAAAEFLRRRGYRIAQRNYTTRVGEIDIVAVDEGMVVFVEVKSRVSTEYGPPEFAVDGRKQAKLRRIAQLFLESHKLLDTPCRFDIVALTRPEGGNWHIELIRDAF